MSPTWSRRPGPRGQRRRGAPRPAPRPRVPRPWCPSWRRRAGARRRPPVAPSRAGAAPVAPAGRRRARPGLRTSAAPQATSAPARPSAEAPRTPARPSAQAPSAPRRAGPTAIPELDSTPPRPAPRPAPAAPAPQAAPRDRSEERPSDPNFMALRGEGEAPELRPGLRLGDYRLESLLGEGGSACVWRATDVRLHMPIALKLFNPSGRGGRSLLRGVMREARAASRVVSDHVIRVKDAGYWEDVGLGFIAMELCAAYPDAAELQQGSPDRLMVGRTLEQTPPVSLRECLRVMAEATRGVADAHREGVFHRDIKPANILLRPGSRRAQITDFGLTVAELRSKRSASVRIAVDQSKRRFIQGTPEYMAPEAAMGLPLGLDPDTDRPLLTGLDVYGLGATLYALLAGDLPFAARPGVKNPIADVLHQVQAGPPQDLMEREHNRVEVPEHVARVVAKAMDRDPDARYATADALAEDLEALIADRPTSLDAPFPGHRLRLYLRRNSLQVSAAASVIIMLGALAGTFVVGSYLDAQVEEAELQITELEGKRAEAQALASHWEQEASVSTRRAKAAATEAAEAREVIAKTETNLGKANSRIRKLTASLDTTSQDLATAALALERTTLERDEALANSDYWKGEASELDEARAAAKAEAERQARRADGAEDARDSALAEASTQRSRAQRAESERDAAQLEIIEARRRASAESARADRAEGELTATEAELRDLNRKLAAAQAIGEAARAEADVLRQRLSAIEESGAAP
ncbi:MAG: protein kinase [Alphaproteobacteria bacterium]|nr:protein kinase [Alphaproteobacteria bacterium]